MSSTQRRRGPGLTGEALAVWGGLTLVLLLVAGTNAAERLTGTAGLPANPLTLTLAVLTGQAPWGTGQTLVAAAVLVLLAAAARAVWVWGRRRRRPGIDRAAAHLARGRDLDRFTRPAAAATARRLGVQTSVPGVFLAPTVAGRFDLWADWESTEVDIWGPRTGKTTSRAIPTVLDAPGAVLATSNRRDLVDATRDPRRTRGQVWVFDPQAIVGEPPAFCWDPLSYVTSGPLGSEVKAQQLAALFAAAVAPPDSKTDRFFDPKGQTLLGHLLHAAALDGQATGLGTGMGIGMSGVYRWVNRETDTTPARILDRHGFAPSGDYVRGIIAAPDKQRGGIYATAELCITWLTNRAAADWITPAPGRTAFDPAAFATSTDTLYLLSREGRGTLAPLTTALTAAVCEAAEHTATTSPSGRLPVPLVAVLDEVANVCRWPDLPDLYSHYGGRGIYLLAILQSWRQGEDTWGPRGMAKLWSAATVRIYGGGDTEVPFLDELRRLAGSYRPTQTSTTTARGGRTVNTTETTEDILDVADLAALPRGRAILIGSGIRPVLIAPRPWHHTPWAEPVQASIAAHDPAPPDSPPAVGLEPDVTRSAT